MKDARRLRAVAALLLLPVFYLAHYQLLQSLRGWPSDANLPPRFDLVGFRITEPDPTTGTGGQILLWAVAKDRPEPRVYRLGYARELHSQLVDAGERQKQGQPQAGIVTRTTGERGQATTQVRFEDRDDDALPPKPTAGG